MKKQPILSLGVLGIGAFGAGLRLWLLKSQTPDSSLLANDHPANLLLTLLTLGLLAALFCATRDMKKGGKYSTLFPASWLRCGGAAVAAVGFLTVSLQNLTSSGDSLSKLWGIAGLLAAAAMSFVSFCRIKGRHPVLFFQGYVCLYLMIHMICQYRIWSVEPQIQTYCFHLLATVTTMLSCYHNAAFDGNCGSRRAHTVLHLAAVYFCCLALVGDHTPFFYLTMGIWMLTDLCAVPTPRRKTVEDAQ